MPLPGTEVAHRDDYALRLGLLSADQESRDPPLISLMASIALINKLRITCCNWTSSPRIVGRLSANSVRAETSFFAISPWVNSMTSKIVSLMSNRSFRGGAFLTRARIRSMTAAARTPLSTIKPQRLLNLLEISAVERGANTRRHWRR